jgi:hypothetical protein
MKYYNLFGINDTGCVVLKQTTTDYMNKDRKMASGTDDEDPLLTEDH